MNNPSFPFHTPPHTTDELQATIETNLQGNHYHRRSSNHHHVNNNNNDSIMNSPFWGLVLGSDGQMHPVTSSDVLGGSMKQIGSVPIYMALPSTTASSITTNSGFHWPPATNETNPLSSANAGIISKASSSLSLLKPTTTAGFSNSQFLSNSSASPLLGSWPHLVAAQLPSTATAAASLLQQQQRMAVPPNHWANANSIMAHPLVAAAAAAGFTSHQQQQQQQPQQQQPQPEGWLSRMAFALNTSLLPRETLTHTTDARAAAATIPKTDRETAATGTTTPFPVPSQSTIHTTATATATTTSPRHNVTGPAESPQAHSRKTYPDMHDDDSQVDQQQQQPREEKEKIPDPSSPPPPQVRRRKRKHHFKDDLPQPSPAQQQQQQREDERHSSNVEHEDDNNTVQEDDANNNNNNGDDTAETNQQQPLYQHRFLPFQADMWGDRFYDLLAYKQEHGHCHVPLTYQANPVLARWVKRQRYQYKLYQEGRSSTMTPERVQALQDIGFVWDSQETSWNEKYAELVAFHKEHGHCNVPTLYGPNPSLAVWVKYQRKQYRYWQQSAPSALTPQRISDLERIGFAWLLRSYHRKSGKPKKRRVQQQQLPASPEAPPCAAATTTTTTKASSSSSSSSSSASLSSAVSSLSSSSSSSSTTTMPNK